MKRAKLAGEHVAHFLPGPGDMVTALCGVHPFWPGKWIREKTEQLRLCSGCRENTVEQGEMREHAFDQVDQVSRGEAALYTALAEISRVRAVAEETEACGGDCCPLEVEVEDARGDLADAERSLRRALRILAARRHRLDVVLEGEA